MQHFVSAVEASNFGQLPALEKAYVVLKGVFDEKGNKHFIAII